MIQTYDSIVTFDIPRSIEHLRLLLFYDQQIHSVLMKQFFTYYSLRYSCSMSLALTLTSIPVADLGGAIGATAPPPSKIFYIRKPIL
jgi:hypothetical protein